MSELDALSPDELVALRDQLRDELAAERGKGAPQVQSGQPYTGSAGEHSGTVTREDGRELLRHDQLQDATAGALTEVVPSDGLRVADIPARNGIGQTLTTDEKFAAMFAGQRARAEGGSDE